MTGRHTRTAATLTGLVAALALALAGCAKDESPPTVMKTPAIVWQDGIEPSSPLESDERVIAARQGETGHAMAKNSGDFTIAQLTNHVTEDLIDNYARAYGSEARRDLPP